MDFDAYLQSKGYSGRVPAAVAKQLHAAWIKETGGGFKPEIVEVPVPGGGSERAFMSSPNSATLMRDPQSRVRYEVGNDGNLYMIDGTTAAVVTNAVGGAPLQPNAKSSAFDDVVNVMEQERARRMQQNEQPGLLTRIFGGGGGQPAPSPAPAATPMPAPVATGTPMPTPAPAATNAPAPVPTPSPVDLSTPEGIRAAWQSGRLSDQEAVRMLRGQP
jgi:hypothetical protein